MPLEVGSCVTGEVSSVVAEGVLVSLPEGCVGLAATSSTGGTREPATLHVGERVTVRVVGAGVAGRLDVVVLSGEDRPTDAFDREFHRLRSVLRSRSSKLPAARGGRPRLAEEEIEKWLAQAESGLSRLGEHRAERLAEAFYDEEAEGERDAQRSNPR